MIGVDYGSVDSNAAPDWDAAKRAGVTFAIIRGAYSATVDPHFLRDYDAIGAAGLVRGAYLFLRYPHASDKAGNLPQPEAQARALVDALVPHTRTALDLPPTLDVEFPGNGRVAHGITVETALDWTRRAWRVLRDAFGVAPIIYTSARVWRDDLADAPAPDLIESPLWLARYPFRTRISAVTAPSVVSPIAWPPTPRPWGDAGNSWLHQYQGDAIGMPGFTSTVDLSRFRSLRVGAFGDRVAWLQRRLGRAETGVFDNDLERVVITFQRMLGLEQDGVIGVRTFAAACWSGYEQVGPVRAEERREPDAAPLPSARVVKP